MARKVKVNRGVTGESIATRVKTENQHSGKTTNAEVADTSQPAASSGRRVRVNRGVTGESIATRVKTENNSRAGGTATTPAATAAIPSFRNGGLNTPEVGLSTDRAPYTTGETMRNRASAALWSGSRAAGDDGKWTDAEWLTQMKNTRNDLAATARSNEDYSRLEALDKQISEETKRLGLTLGNRVGNGLVAAGTGLVGGILSLGETGAQMVSNTYQNQTDRIRTPEHLAETEKLSALQEALWSAERYGDVLTSGYRSLEELRAAVDAQRAVVEGLEVHDRVDQSLPGQRLLATSRDALEDATAGMSDTGKFLAQTGVSIAQNLPTIALGTAVSPALGLGLMGAAAGGQRANELTLEGMDPADAFAGGLVSGGVEILTEKMPLETLASLIKRGGKSALASILKQMGVEAGEEAASYVMNYAADLAMQHPDAEFTMAGLVESALGGAISGGVFGGAGVAINHIGSRGARATVANTQANAQINEQTTEQAPTERGVEQMPGKTAETAATAAQNDAFAVRTGTDMSETGNAQETPLRAAETAQTGTAKTEQARAADTAAWGAYVNSQVQRGKALGESGKRAFQTVLQGDEGGDSLSFYKGFMDYYNAGVSGQKQVKSQYAGRLTSAQQYAAYAAGQNDGAASLAAEKRGVGKVTVYNREAGLVENEHSAALDEGVRGTLHDTARSLGLKVVVDGDTGESGVSGGNGYLDGNGVLHVSAAADDPVDVVRRHEVTHRLQELAPAEYRNYRDYVMRMQGDQTQAILDKQVQYKTASGGKVVLSNEEAMDEIAADYAGRVMTDEATIRQIMQDDRTLGEKLRDIIRTMARKIKEATGRADPTLEEAVRLWNKAYRAAEKNVQKAQGQNKTAQEGGEKRYSIKYDQANNPYVVIESDILAGVPRSKWVKTVKDNLRQKFPDGVTVGNSVININSQSRREMTFSNYMQQLMRDDRSTFADKLRATDNADEILKASQNWVNEALLHPRHDSIVDFARGEVLFQIGTNDYSAQVVVGNRGNGNLMLYDIINLAETAIQGRTKKADTANTTNTQDGPRGRQAVSNEDSVPQEGGEVKGKFSLKEDSAGNALTEAEVRKVQGIGRKSINDFTSVDIAATEGFARQYWKEMGEKSPFFRAWFGDWRANDQTPVKVADTQGDARGVQRNEDTGWDIQVSRKVFSETQAHAGEQNRAAVPYLPYINDIVKKAVLLDSHALGKTKSANSLLMHSLYGVADIGNGPEIVKLYVEEMNDPNRADTAKRAYQLQDIEISSLKVTGSGRNPSRINQAADVHTISDLFAAVKGRDKNFKPRPASKVVDEDGRPLVVYHGTDAEFTAFDSGKTRSAMDIQGNFFSPWELDAQGYGGNVRAFYLNLRNPAPEGIAYKALNRFQGQEGAGKKARDYLIRLGYDGVNNNGEEYISFYPEQSKSATDNTGAFDRSNPDIRFSLKGDAWTVPVNENGEAELPETLSYRAGKKVSDWGHAMFADDPDSGWGNYRQKVSRGDGDVYAVAHSELTDISELKEEIARRWDADRADGFAEYYGAPIDDYLAELSGAELAEEFDPQDIVDSAAGYDNGELNEWLWNRVLEPGGIAGVKTADGAVVYDEGIIHRVTAEKTAARYSLKNADGKQVVWIENSQLTNKELNNHKAVAAYIAQHIGEVYTIIESGQNVYIGEDLPGEYTQSRYTTYLRGTDRAAARAKNKAASGFGELIETATNRKWEPTKHADSKDAKYGMYRYSSTFAFPVKGNSGTTERVRAYNVELLIRNASDGKKYLYDIVNVKENTTAQIDLTQREARSAAYKAATGGDVSMESIPQDGGKGKGKNSLKDSREAEVRQLRDRAERQQELVSYLKAQMKVTEGAKTDPKAVARLAKEVAREYSSEYDGAKLGARLQEMYDYIASGKDGKGRELTWSALRERAYGIARDVLMESRELNDSMARDYSGLKAYLKETQLTISEADSHDMTDYNAFRQRNQGRMKLKRGSTNIDRVYMELAERWPGLFDETATHPAQQLERIGEVLDEMEPVYENPYSADMDEAADYVAAELIERFYDTPQQAPTFADRQQKKLTQQKISDTKKLERLREQKDARIAAVREQGKARTKEAVARVRQQRDEALERLRERNAQVRENQRARKEDSAARQRLLKIANRLNNKKLTEVNRTLLNQYIGELDTVSVNMTGATITKLTDLKAWYETEKETNPDFIADEATERKLARLQKVSIATMTPEQVAELTEVLLNIENEINTQRRLIDKQDRRDTYLLGEEVIRDIESTKGSRGGPLDELIVSNTLSPVREVRRLTGYVDSDPLLAATNDLADGQRTMLDYQMRAERPFRKWAEDKKFSKAFSGPDAKGITVRGMTKDGMKEVTITPAMRAALYLHARNDQNLRHIMDGGITVPDMALYKKGKLAEAYARGTTIKLTPSQVRDICLGMTEEERAFARETGRYFNETSRSAINGVSEKLKGYSIAGVENYFPINTDTSFTRADFESIKFDGTIEGMGFLKDRQTGAANPILLRDANLVLEQSIQQHARYVGLAIPVRNFNKLWGVTQKGYTGSVQQAVKKQWGTVGYDYIEKMMNDLQGNRKSQKGVARALSKIRSNYAGAVLSLNLSVAMKQAASYPTAAAVTGWGPLMKAMGSVGKVDLALIEKYTPLQWYRSKGYSTRELGDLKTAGRQLPAVLNWIQAVDLATTRKLWKAAEFYVQEHNKALNRGTDAYYRAVAEVYNRVIEETQPNYTTMQRPQLLRTEDTLMQNLAMFKTQPFQNFNILYDAAENLAAKSRRNRAENTAESRAALSEAKENFGRAATSQLAQLAVFAGMTMAWAMLRGKRDKYEDEEGDMTLVSMLTALGKDMAGGLFSVVPGGSSVWEISNSLLLGDTYYGLDAVTVTAISDMASSMIGVAKLLRSIAGSAATREEIDWKSAGLKLDGYLDDISKAFGVPYENVTNLFQATARQILVRVHGKYLGEYYAALMASDPSGKSSTYYDILWDALRHDDISAWQDIAEDAANRGLSSEGIESAMRSRYEKAAEADPAFSLSQKAGDLIRIQPQYSGETETAETFGADDLDPSAYRGYQEQRAETYRTIADALEQSGCFERLDDGTKDSVLDAADKLARDLALVEHSDGQYTPDGLAQWERWATMGEDYGVDETEAILFRAAYNMAESDRDENGNTISGSRKENTLEIMEDLLPGLSDEELDYLMSIYWTPEDDALKAMKESKFLG